MNREGTPAGFVEIEHTADRSIEVWAHTPGELFEQAARGLFSLMTDLSQITPLRHHEVILDMDDLESILVDWLNELLYWHETRGEIYSEFRVSLERGKLHARFAGRPAEPTSAVVKAATFHNLLVQQDDAGIWRATIVFDT